MWISVHGSMSTYVIHMHKPGKKVKASSSSLGMDRKGERTSVALVSCEEDWGLLGCFLSVWIRSSAESECDHGETGVQRREV